MRAFDDLNVAVALGFGAIGCLDTSESEILVKEAKEKASIK